MRPIRLAIVDDALFIREGLKRLLADDGRIAVVGTAATGEELLANLDAWRPDAITLDIHMPGLGGLATLDRLMASHPLPVIVLSTHTGPGAPLTVEALSRGAVDFIDKEAYSLVDFETLRGVLVERILAVAGRNRGKGTNGDRTRPCAAPGGSGEDGDGFGRRYDLVAIGASTGGPRAIEAVLVGLGADVSALPPIAVVQHMPPGFTQAFAERLDRALPFTVREAVPDAPLEPGTVMLAPGGCHMALTGDEARCCVALHDRLPETIHTPSVDVLFSSAGEILGDRVVAVLLTGMGRDGAQGMAALAGLGAYTIAQDEASSVVYGMPRAAVEGGAAREVLSLEHIGPRVRALLDAGLEHQGSHYEQDRIDL